MLAARKRCEWHPLGIRMTNEPLLNPLRLVALSGPMAGEVLPAAGAEVTLGRDPASGICVADR